MSDLHTAPIIADTDLSDTDELPIRLGGTAGLLRLTLAKLKLYLSAAKVLVPVGGTTGQVLAKLSNADDDVHWVSPSSGATALGGLTDVDLTTPPTDGQALVYNNAASKWKPGTVGSGGGGGGTTPTIRSYLTATGYSGNGATIPFPSTVQAGDIVVCWMQNGYNSINGVPTDSSGWLVVDVNNGGYTNGCCIAKVVTTADITQGHVTLTAGGSFSGVYAAVAIDGTTVNALDRNAGFASAGSAAYPSGTIAGLTGAASTDLILVFVASRGASTAITAGPHMTLLGTLGSNTPGGGALGGLYQISAAGMGKLGVSESIAFTGGANNGVYYSLVAFK